MSARGRRTTLAGDEPKGDVKAARRLAALTFALGVPVTCAYTLAIFFCAEPIAGLFTHDARVLRGALEIWPKVCVSMVLDGVMCLTNGLIRGLSMQRRSAACVIVCLWCIGGPLIVTQAETLGAVWLWMIPSYVLLDVCLLLAAFSANWARVAENIRQAGTSSTLASADAASKMAQQCNHAAELAEVGGQQEGARGSSGRVSS